MKPVPEKIETPFIAFLKQKRISSKAIPYYLKWLKYYLDYCEKYTRRISDQESMTLFLEKLEQKNQTKQQIKQAKQAIDYFFILIKDRKISTPAQTGAGKNDLQKPKTEQPGISSGQSWKTELDTLDREIRVRQYSRKTLKTYKKWAQIFQAYLKSKSPGLVDSQDAKNFITYLAVDKQVSAATQNLAFNALLFFFRHVLHKEFGDFKGIPRAKRTQYVPAVLSRKEIDAIIENLQYPYTLVVKLLYGCGLRLTEGLNIRVQDIDFEEGILTIFGKGRKFRKVGLPEKIIPEMKAHLERVKKRHELDIKEGYDGVFLPGLLDSKYKNAAKEFRWQFFFPAKQLTRIPNTKFFRRYHLHETHVQKAVKAAAQKVGISKRATPHTFRHSFATHLLKAGYDIRTVQELLGHSDVRTTMIYTRTLKSRQPRELKSPYDIDDID